MALNGSPLLKRPKIDGESGDHRNYGDQLSGFGDDLRRKRSFNEVLNHVLLFTITKPIYPITVDVLNSICSPIGKVLRIVIFKKNGVQAMVEFDCVDSAKRAKETLNGADIYSGCCTLKIEYAKTSKLNVHKNDSESWDYTNPLLCKPNAGDNEFPRPAPLLPEPPRYSPAHAPGAQPYRSGPRRGGMAPYDPPERYDDGYQNWPGGDTYDRFGDRYPPADRFGEPDYRDGGIPRPAALAQSPRGPGSQKGTVLMVYGLNTEKINADKLFNIFCLYGNVFRIKFLRTKEGCAMIQMGDALAVERCVQNLHNVIFMDSKLQVGYSKQEYLNDVQNPYNLPDGTPSFKDFMGNRNNRFTNPVMAQKNRIQPPSKVLHFFNTPPNVKEETVREIFERNNAPIPRMVKLLPHKTERSSSGLLEFDDVSTAMEALATCNHVPISESESSKFPYIMKLCFSISSRYGIRSDGRMKEDRNSEDA